MIVVAVVADVFTARQRIPERRIEFQMGPNPPSEN